MKKRREPEELSFWQSYSDMMAALLLVFVLIIAFSVSMMTKATETYNEKLIELNIKDKEISDYKDEIDKQQVQLDKLIGVRSELIKKLRIAFETTSMGLSVNSETGAISFDSKILFDFNKYELKQSGIDFLNKFFPKYFEVIFDETLNAYIAEVIIEGHTDNSGKYLYNLDLSQKRAFAVAEYCLRDETKMFDDIKLDKVRRLVTANGRAYYELKYLETGEVDLVGSRRVEIKFRLKEEEMIKEMSALLETKIK